MITKIKLFHKVGSELREQAINEFMKTVNVVDVKINSENTIMVIYTEVER